MKFSIYNRENSYRHSLVEILATNFHSTVMATNFHSTLLWDLQRLEYEAQVKRQLEFVDQLVEDKGALSAKCEELAAGDT